jgi:hypothetical protein
MDIFLDVLTLAIAPVVGLVAALLIRRTVARYERQWSSARWDIPAGLRPAE